MKNLPNPWHRAKQSLLKNGIYRLSKIFFNSYSLDFECQDNWRKLLWEDACSRKVPVFLFYAPVEIAVEKVAKFNGLNLSNL
jgi:hypothetical protein